MSASSGGIAWESITRSDASEGYSLRSALLTTYDQPDGRFLAEHLLPSLFRLNYEPNGDGEQHHFFLAELKRRLAQLQGRIFVVSSPGMETSRGPYDWIWQPIRRLTVGRDGAAVQHAKLWILHWVSYSTDSEILEIVVSSANLAQAALAGQIQAGWRCLVPLASLATVAARGSWGVLPAFLERMGRSTGMPEALNIFQELLARATCPKGVTFLGSVPGTHDARELRRLPWGVAGLGSVSPGGRGPVRLRALTPYVGAWTQDELVRWCERFEGAPDKFEIAWIRSGHPWSKHWILPRLSMEALRSAGASFHDLAPPTGNHSDGDPGLVHEEHRPEDLRWWHGKIYELKRGRGRRLIVTSANLSRSAWGRPLSENRLFIKNFELGVCVDAIEWPLPELPVFNDERDIAACEIAPAAELPVSVWADAVWDGQIVEITCRASCWTDLVAGVVVEPSGLREVRRWQPSTGADGALRVGRVRWANQPHPPRMAEVRAGGSVLRFPIADGRPIDTDPPPDTSVYMLEASTVQQIEDRLLFEEYGGDVADDIAVPQPACVEVGLGEPVRTEPSTSDEPTEQPLSPAENQASASPDSFSVPTFALARERFRIVDNWSARVAQVVERESRHLDLRLLRRDGDQLVAALQRQAARDNHLDDARGLGSTLAAEELQLRVQALDVP